MSENVSVIMISHNRQNFLKKSIESILNQTYLDFEFIIIENGSVDNSKEIINNYAAQDKRIKVIETTEVSIGRARNIGIDVAIGTYIMFVDDDDYAYPDMIEFLVDLHHKYVCDISVCGSVRTCGGIDQPYFVYNETYELNSAEATIEFMKRKLYNAPMPTKLFRKELFDVVRFEEKGKFDDIRIGYKLFANALKTVACGQVKYSFTEHAGNNSKAARSSNLLYPELLEEYFLAFRERTDYIRKKLPEVYQYAQYSEWSYMISMYDKIVTNDLINCNDQKVFIYGELMNHYYEFTSSPYIKDFEVQWMNKYIMR